MNPITPRLFDTHCHLNSAQFDGCRRDVIQRARADGIEKMVVIGTDFQTSQHAMALSRVHHDLLCAAGVHPHEAESCTVEQLGLFASYYDTRMCHAIGECGLDYFYEYSDREKQKEVFNWHIEQSQRTKLPLVIHIRDAWEDALACLRRYNQHVGVIHCFSGTTEQAAACLALGFYISIPGIVTFKNAADLRETTKHVPSDRLLIETDSPFLAPIPHRGKKNEPRFVRHVFEAVCELRDVSASEHQAFAQQLWDNSCRLFNVNKLQ